MAHQHVIVNIQVTCAESRSAASAGLFEACGDLTASHKKLSYFVFSKLICSFAALITWRISCDLLSPSLLLVLEFELLNRIAVLNLVM
jgi:hypothetical protein